MLIALVLVALVESPSPASQQGSQAAQLKVIGHVHSSSLCNTLTHNIFQSIVGLRANDGLLGNANHMIAKLEADAITDPKGASITGGASAASEMDDMQLGSLLRLMSKNMDKIDALLNDPERFAPNPTQDDERRLALARASLEAVLTQQRAVMNLLYGANLTNESRDLEARTDPVPDDTNGHVPVTLQRVSNAQALRDHEQLTAQAEEKVTPAILPISQLCKR